MKFFIAPLILAALLSCESPTLRTGEPGCVYRDMTGQDEESDTVTITITIQ